MTSIIEIRRQFQFATTNLPALDDRLEDSDIKKILDQLTRPTGPLEKMPKNLLAFTLAEFAYNAALVCANDDYNFEDAEGGGWPVVSTQNQFHPKYNYSSILAEIKALGYHLNQFYHTFATEIYNEMNKRGEYTHKYARRGFTFEKRFLAFPGASSINKTYANPPVTEEDFVLINDKAEKAYKKAFNNKIKTLALQTARHTAALYGPTQNLLQD